MKHQPSGRLRAAIRSTSVAFITASLTAAPTLHAGDHWLSGVSLAPAAMTPMGRSAPVALASPLTTASTSYNITISLDSNPQGDDDSTVDAGATDEQQRAYEARIKEFAKAVYQSTNGGHKIGKVTIFRAGAFANSADVRWDETCAATEGPRANPSGFGQTGKHIWMCTNWSGAGTLMPDPKGSGYTLAHEWGHYAYGLYDEYAQGACTATTWIGKPCSSDTVAIPAIMNNQWVAASGTVPAGYSGSAADFLEFSTQNIHPYKSDSTGTNAQKRVFGESAWQTLTRDPSTDPKFSWLPSRTQYSGLTAPSDPNWIVKDDESTALSELDIRWVGNQVVDLSIDVSGSMSGSPLANAKTGANLLIDQIRAGTAIGVSSFESSVWRNFLITDIPDPDTGVRASAKAAVNALSASGLTSLYDGLIFSLNGTQSFDLNRPALVYVLSDGGDNDSAATEASVIAAYQAAGVPIIAFAYGSGAPTGTLFSMANATGGALYLSPTTAAEIQAVLLAADARFSSNVLLSSETIAAAGSATTARTIPLDSTLGSARVNLTYVGSAGDFVFSLLAPNGTDTGLSFACEGAASCSAEVDATVLRAFGYGDYQVEMANTSGAVTDVTLLVLATPAGTESYDIAVGFSSSTVNYPADLAITATVTRGPAIAGLDVVAKVTGPAGVTFDLPLLDDGLGADLVGDDGTYSASIPYTASGIYSAVVTASNAGATATTTFEGVAISLREDGTAWIPATTAVTENFVRVGTGSASVVGVMSDDHANDPAGGQCTQIADDNTDTAGRIDYAGDADCFVFVPGATNSPLVVRATSLTSRMAPVVTVYDSFARVITQVDLATSDNPASGVTVGLSPTDLDPTAMAVVVEHADATATVGGYVVSAGAPLRSDAPRDSDGDGVPDERDACPASNTRDLVAIGRCDCGVQNDLMADGCTVADLVLPVAEGPIANLKKKLSAVQRIGFDLQKKSVLTLQDVRALVSCTQADALKRCWKYVEAVK